MRFEQAMIASRNGKHIRRDTWDNKDLALAYRRPWGVNPEGLYMITLSGDHISPWTPQNADLFATNWEILT